MADHARQSVFVIDAGKLGHVQTRHGARDRWDWSVTAVTLQTAQERHARLQALADSLTPEQRAALWTTTDERAALLRRFVR